MTLHTEQLLPIQPRPEWLSGKSIRPFCGVLHLRLLVRVIGVHASITSTSHRHLSTREQTTGYPLQAIERTLQFIEHTLLLHLSGLDR